VTSTSFFKITYGTSRDQDRQQHIDELDNILGTKHTPSQTQNKAAASVLFQATRIIQTCQ